MVVKGRFLLGHKLNLWRPAERSSGSAGKMHGNSRSGNSGNVSGYPPRYLARRGILGGDTVRSLIIGVPGVLRVMTEVAEKAAKAAVWRRGISSPRGWGSSLQVYVS